MIGTLLYPALQRLAVIALIGLCLVPAATWADDDPREFQLRWQKRVYAWTYNPKGEPEWLGEEEALKLVREAAAGWEPCGVTLRYEGTTDRRPGEMDGINVVGWRSDGKAHSAWTSWRAHRDGRAVEADVIIYANVFDIYRRRNTDARLELRKSLIHEFGHVLGLGHSDLPGDAMAVKARTRPEWRLPSDNDLARCRDLYPR